GPLISAIGASIFLQNAVMLTQGARMKVYMTSLLFPRSWRIQIAGASISALVIVMVVVAGLMMWGLHLLVQRTTLGRSLRAMAEPGCPRWAAAVLGVVALVAPLVAPDDYGLGVMARICLYATLALGLNIVVGFAGLLDLGYGAFFGIGSYLYTFLASAHFGLHLPFLVTLPIVIVLTAGSGVLIGAPTLRLAGDYLAIVTLRFITILSYHLYNSVYTSIYF